jgi:hypothetical protein
MAAGVRYCPNGDNRLIVGIDDGEGKNASGEKALYSSPFAANAAVRR